MIPGLLASLKDPQFKEFNSIQHHHNADPTFIPLHLTGGIGDVVISIDAIKELEKDFQLVIYTHHLDAFRYFYNGSSSSFKVLPEYTWVMEFNTIAKFHFRYGFHGFLIKDHEDLFLKQQEAFRSSPRLESIVKTHFDRFFLISEYANEIGVDRRRFPMHSLGYNENFPYDTKWALYPRRRSITIHDGFDIHNRHVVSGRATKQWSWAHWNTLVKELKKKYPEYKIIQLGTSSTARAIDGVDECLIDKTTITEAFNFIQHASLHIDGDSGLAHAATRLKTPCMVLWGPTPHSFYGYPQNINLTSQICPGSCYGTKVNWNDKCPVGYPTPVCMDEISPEQVLANIPL